MISNNYYSYNKLMKECKICIIPKEYNTSLSDYDLSSLSSGDSIYIDIFLLHHLQLDLLKINIPFVLVTGKGELNIDNIFKTNKEMDKFIENPYLLHWYCINNTMNNKKITTIPLGLEIYDDGLYDYIYEIQKNCHKFYERVNLCYLHSQNNNHFINDKLYLIGREEIIGEIPNNLLYIEKEELTKNNLWLNMTRFSYIICYSINTLDNSDIYESLCLGCIPIILSSNLNKLYEDLPVLIVNKWSDINKELLESTLEYFKIKYNLFKYEKLGLNYWIDKINQHKRNQDDNYCYYYSSHGIMKSCDIYGIRDTNNSYKEDNKTIKGHMCIIKNYDFSKIKDNSIVYINIDAIYHFYTYYLPKINHKIIVVSGDHDFEPEYILNNTKDFFNFINNPKIIHWFSINSIIRHPKFTIIPYGLDYHTLSRYRSDIYWAYRQITPLHQEKELEEIKLLRELFWKRCNMCYVNFHFSMNNKYCYDRHDALEQIPKELLYIEEYPLLRQNSWLNMSLFSFVVSPHGNGLDCIRTWEALVFGCIPIVKKSPIDVLYEDLPVLIVDEWNHITRELLDKTLEDYKIKYNSFKYEKLTLQYWVDKIKSYRIY